MLDWHFSQIQCLQTRLDSFDLSFRGTSLKRCKTSVNRVFGRLSNLFIPHSFNKLTVTEFAFEILLAVVDKTVLENICSAAARASRLQHYRLTIAKRYLSLHSVGYPILSLQSTAVRLFFICLSWIISKYECIDFCGHFNIG